MTCNSCNFYHDNGAGRTPECRRFPPVIIAKVQDDEQGRYTTHHAKFPFIKDDLWCGEYVAKR